MTTKLGLVLAVLVSVGCSDMVGTSWPIAGTYAECTGDVSGKGGPWNDKIVTVNGYLKLITGKDQAQPWIDNFSERVTMLGLAGELVGVITYTCRTWTIGA